VPEAIYYMKIKDLSKKSGVSRYSIHHYLRLGLLPEPHKKNKTMAYYGEVHLERLNLIKTLRDQGLSLYVIQQMLTQNTEARDFKNSIKRNPAARQVRKQKELKRKELIVTAGRVFSEKGYYRTSISDITDELGIGKSTFYLYFRNKKELFFSCIDDILDNLWKEDWDRILGESDPGIRLGLRAEAFIRVYPRVKDILQMMRGASVGQEEGIGKKYQEIYAKIARPVIKDLQKGMELGRFKQGDPELLAYVMVGVAEAIAYRVHMDGKYSIEDGVELIRQFRFFS